MKKFLKIIVLILLSLLILIGIIASCGESDIQEKKEEAPIESINMPEETGRTNLSIDECLFLLKTSMESSFDSNIYYYSIVQDGNVIMINQWWDNITDEITIVSNEQWNITIESLKTSNNAAQQLFIANNHPEIVVVNNLVSEINPPNYIFLSISNSKVIYDIRNGIDEYGINS